MLLQTLTTVSTIIIVHFAIFSILNTILIYNYPDIRELSHISTRGYKVFCVIFHKESFSPPMDQQYPELISAWPVFPREGGFQ